MDEYLNRIANAPDSDEESADDDVDEYEANVESYDDEFDELDEYD